MELTVFSGPGDAPPPYHLNGWSLVLFAAMSLPLVIRRRNMLIAYALIQAATLLAILAHVEVDLLGLTGWIFTAILIFAVADRAPAALAVLAMFAELGLLWLQAEIQHFVPDARPFRLYILGIFNHFPFWTLGAFAGWTQRRRRALTARLEARNNDVRLERERLAAQAVSSERIRIAYELRAVVIRGVERMTGQARRARRDVEARSAAAWGEITEIEVAGRHALIEMRRLLLVLRGSEARASEPGGNDPLPAATEAGTSSPDPAAGLGAGMSLPSWIRQPWVVDIGLVLLLVGFEVAGWINRGISLRGDALTVPIPSAAIIGALLVRSRAPFSVLCVVCVAVTWWIVATGNTPNWTDEALLLAVYTVAAYKEPRWALAAVALAVLSWSPHPIEHLCLCLFHIGTLAILAAAAGVAMRGGRRLNDDLRKQTDLLIRTRKERVRQAVVQERTRVAREMHDAVAHGLTVMVVQAGGARLVADNDPAQAAEALADVERIGVETTRELRLLLPTPDPDSEAVKPGPPVDAVDVKELVEHVRRTGQEVELIEEGAGSPTDEGIRASAYRIIQEALTNVGKHAPGSRAVVAIRHQAQGVEVEVTNGRPPTPKGSAELPGAGQGLIGIRERAAVFGGTVEVGPTAEGGFRVFVRLPLELVPA